MSWAQDPDRSCCNQERFQHAGRLNVLDMLDHGCWFQVREPVDQVSALFGVMDREALGPVEVDHSEEAKRTFWHLYLQVAKATLGQEGIEGLEILSQAESSTAYVYGRANDILRAPRSREPTCVLLQGEEIPLFSM
jgi:hypothetical protein